MRVLKFVVVALCLLVTTSPVQAQELGFLTSAFKNVHTITFSAQGGDLTEKSGLATNNSKCSFLNVCGLAAEVLFDVPSSSENWHVELGIGASYLRGFHEAEGSPYEIRGAVRSFPTIAAYVTNEADEQFLQPYFGVSFGFADLWNVQAYDMANREYSIKGQTFDYGATAGVYFPATGRVGLFLEANYRRRRFPSLDWSKDSLPGIPREFNTDALVGAIGLQFDIREEAKQPPAFGGTWVLTKVDGQGLPAVWEARDASGRSVRQEVVSGSLDLSDERFVIHLWTRESQYQSGALIVATSPPKLEPVVGRIEKQAAALILHPTDSQIAQMQVRRAGDEIVLRHRGRVLTFSRIGQALQNQPF